MIRKLAIGIVILLAALVALPPLWYAIFTGDPPPGLPEPGHRVVLASGVGINIVEQGAGPPVLLVHGLPGMANDWRELSREPVAFSGQPMPEWWIPGVVANFQRWDTFLTNRGELFGLDPDAGFDYGEIDVPTLLLHGDDDRLADIAISRYLVTLIPDATLLETPSGSHMLPVTHAPEMAGQIVSSGAE